LEQLLQAIILGIIQGIAEWLPISSTGHIRLIEYFLGLQLPLLFAVILHIGTLIVIFIFFRRDIKNILIALTHRDFKSENGRLIPLIIVGSIPTAIIGYLLSDTIEHLSSTILPIAIAFVISGTLLFTSRFAREKTGIVTYQTALIFGIAQGIAVMPGISRSGTTIAVALLLGIKREKAFKFSFLLSIPAIIGALILETFKDEATLSQSGFTLASILTGVLAAMLIGYLTLNLLWRIIERKMFHFFALYCWILGAALIILIFLNSSAISAFLRGIP